MGVKMNETQTFLDNRLRRAWLDQLRQEYEDVCYQYRISLQLPSFELSDSKTCLGSWHDGYRTLSISTWLIRKYSWATVQQVLKHEMAHQLCTDYFAAPNAGHGPIFYQACELVGLSGDFCKARSDCAEVLETQETSSSPETTNGRKILAKIEKLLALAGSDNEHEASLAMQRAGELLSRHNLAMPTTEQSDYQHLILDTGKKRMPGHLRRIGSLLQDYFFVQIVFSHMYDPVTAESHKTIDLFGRPENVAVAEHCYYFLTAKLESLWQENRPRFKGGGQRARNSYLHGVVAGFREKLAAGEEEQRHRKTAHDNGQSVSELVIMEDAGLQNFMASQYPRLVTSRRRSIRLHADAYNDALATGKTLVLHRAMEESGSGGGGLLE